MEISCGSYTLFIYHGCTPRHKLQNVSGAFIENKNRSRQKLKAKREPSIDGFL